MLKTLTAQLTFIQFLSLAQCIWLPSYEISLENHETFAFGDNLDVENDFYMPEDEMIQPEQLEPLRLQVDTHMFERLHSQAKRANEKCAHKQIDEKFVDKLIVNETNFDLDDPVPWQAGFIDTKDNFIGENEELDNLLYLQETSKNTRKLEKRKPATTQKAYDYENLVKEFELELSKEKNDNITYNFTDVKETESLSDSIDKITSFKLPKNCTKEESRGIGFKALKCIWRDLKISKNKFALVKRLAKIFLIWFGIYAAIAIPLWCQRGWCCCCCRCQFCKPRKRFDAAKKFINQFPPGKYTENGEVVIYEPTIYETHRYNTLKKALMKI